MALQNSDLYLEVIILLLIFPDVRRFFTYLQVQNILALCNNMIFV